MLQLANRTPYAVQVTILPDRRGVEAVVLIVQGSFRLGSGAVAEDQAPLVMADAWVGEPGQGALRDASDLALEKPATDVLLTGVARPPGGRATPFFASAFSVGPVRKEVAVCGPRTWERSWFGERASPPAAVAEVSLDWDSALGGDRPPQVWHPERPVARRTRVPAPWGGCGPIPPTWAPRVGYAGTYDQGWQRTRAPYLPADFDPRFFQTAPPEQIAPGHLEGGEAIALHGCHPAGDFQGAVPRRQLQAGFIVAGSTQRPPLRLDTIRLLPECDEIRLVWRALLPLGGRVLQLQRVEVSDG
jgi:hypothetical protein